MIEWDYWLRWMNEMKERDVWIGWLNKIIEWDEWMRLTNEINEYIEWMIQAGAELGQAQPKLIIRFYWN